MGWGWAGWVVVLGRGCGVDWVWLGWVGVGVLLGPAEAVEEDSLLLSYSMCFGMYFHLTPDVASGFVRW